jgi:Uma2 family endonuclease
MASSSVGLTMTSDEYLYSTVETNRRRELAYGVVREPPAPFFPHQRVVLHLAALLVDHAGRKKLGEVAIAPLDVVLDRDRNLIVQPDILFIARERLSIIDKQVWGAPDLVVEVLSAGTEDHDRGEKLSWYRQYGVRECWLVDGRTETITVVDFSGPEPVRRTAHDYGIIQSTVLPDLRLSASYIFS